MSNQFTLRLSSFAIEDLGDIWRFTAARAQNKSVADQVTDSIWDAFQFLLANPESGHYREDLAAIPARFHQVYSYLICYITSSSTLTILGVIHASRDAKPILEDRW